MSHSVIWLLEIAIASFAGGLVGSLSGLGGGVVIVPVLTVFLHVPIQDAIGASIVSVIAVSSGAGSVYVKDRLTNVRIAMYLEVATALGAVIGAALLSRLVGDRALHILFGGVLLLSLLPVLAHLGKELPEGVKNDRLAAALRLNSSYYDHRLKRRVDYEVTGVPQATAVMGLAGMVSGLLGIGAGAMKVLAHELCMKVPTKVSTATSNFMIGVTAATAAGVYLRRGEVPPFLVVPVASCVLIGAFTGTRLMERMSNARVRQIFALALGGVGIEMLLLGLGARF
ncbi:MAG: sulfite exporter TauE/SafE family protein [Elusimicrobia bacterium]|nr:sulfite exporter TauE/SafE family protein [Elusimicrobiota bacterium]